MPHESKPWYNPYGLKPHALIAIVLWSVLLVVVLAIAFVRPKGPTVYPIFANAGKTWTRGGSVYGDMRPRLGLDFFRYSPPVAATFGTLSAVSLQAGGVAWRILNAAVFLGGLRWWFRAVLPAKLTRDDFGWLLLLVLPVSAASLHNGQSNPLVIGLLLATLAAVTEERWWLAASAVVIATVLKVYPLSVGLLIAISFPRPLSWRIVVGIGLAAVFPFLTQRPTYVVSQYADWIHYLRTDLRHHVSFERSYRDLRFLFRAWGGRLDNDVYAVLQLVGAAAAAATCLFASLRNWPVRRQLVLALGLGAVWMTLLGPATEPHTYMVLGPTLAWGMLQAWSERRRLAQALLSVAFVLFLAEAVSQPLPGGAAFRHIGPLPLAAILTLLGILRLEIATSAQPGPLALTDDLHLIKTDAVVGRDFNKRWRTTSAVIPPAQTTAL